MGFLMARRAKGDQILASVTAEAAPRLNVMDLKIFHAPARLTTPSISLQDFTAELAIPGIRLLARARNLFSLFPRHQCERPDGTASRYFGRPIASGKGAPES